MWGAGTGAERGVEWSPRPLSGLRGGAYLLPAAPAGPLRAWRSSQERPAVPRAFLPSKMSQPAQRPALLRLPAGEDAASIPGADASPARSRARRSGGGCFSAERGARGCRRVGQPQGPGPGHRAPVRGASAPTPHQALPQAPATARGVTKGLGSTPRPVNQLSTPCPLPGTSALAAFP